MLLFSSIHLPEEYASSIEDDSIKIELDLLIYNQKICMSWSLNWVTF